MAEGGYEYEFVDVLLDRVLCKICHNPCRDVHLTGCCGAHFCLFCLQQLKRGTAVNKACPMCRVGKFKIFPNKRLDREIKALNMYCVNRRSGCSWSGEINDERKHISTDCQFVDVYCPSKCGLKLKRQCLKLHLSKECPCYCQHCGTTGHKEEISKRHKKHCFHYPIPCPNGCEMGVVPKEGIDAHQQICPLELVRCEYFNVGCVVKVTRRELQDHYKQNVSEHLNLTSVKLASVIEEMDRKEKKLVTTTKELESTKSKFNKLEGRITKINKEITEIKSTQCQLGTEVVVPQRITSFVKRKFFEGRLYRLSVIIFCILILHIVHVNITNNRLSQTEQFTWPKTLNRLSISNSNQIAPVTFKIPDYKNKLENDEEWSSPPFYAVKNDCKTWLIVSFFKGKGLMVSLMFVKNSPEDRCYWVRETMFTVELLNQLYNGDHYVSPFFTDNQTCVRNEESIWCTIHFVSDSFLDMKSDQYLKDDNAYLRITQDRSFYNYPYWFIRKVIGPVRSTSEYHAIFLWVIIATNLILEVQDTLSYGRWFNSTGFALLDKICRNMSTSICSVIIVGYMLYCVGLFTM